MREVPPKHPSPPLSSPASTSKAVPRLLATSTSVLLRARSASPSSSPRGVRSRTCDSSRPGQAIAEAQTTRTHSLLSIVHFLTPTTSRILSPTSRSQCRQRRPVGARPRQRRATDAALRRFVLGASSIRTAADTSFRRFTRSLFPLATDFLSASTPTAFPLSHHGPPTASVIVRSCSPSRRAELTLPSPSDASATNTHQKPAHRRGQGEDASRYALRVLRSTRLLTPSQESRSPRRLICRSTISSCPNTAFSPALFLKRRSPVERAFLARGRQKLFALRRWSCPSAPHHPTSP